MNSNLDGGKVAEKEQSRAVYISSSLPTSSAERSRSQDEDDEISGLSTAIDILPLMGRALAGFMSRERFVDFMGLQLEGSMPQVAVRVVGLVQAVTVCEMDDACITGL